MGFFDRLIGKEKNATQGPKLLEDIPKAEKWLIEAMASSGYRLDGTIDSFRELDRFFDEQHRPGGILSGKVGNKLFAIGCYVGQVLIVQMGGTWQTDDSDPQGEINIAVRLGDGSVVWPVQRAMKRFENGAEDSFYAYGMVLKERNSSLFRG